MIPAFIFAAALTAQDTTVVRADNPPVWGTNVRLVRELRIGEVEGEEQYMFGTISSARVAPDGGIFVLDGKAATVRLYDASGKYVKSWGRRGAGPGEIGGSGSIALVADRLIVSDWQNRRLNIYPLSGGEVTHRKLHGGSMWPDSSGLMVLALPGSGPRQRVLRTDPEGERSDTLVLPWEFPKSLTVALELRKGDVFRTMEMNLPYSPEVRWVYSRFGEFVGGNNQKYVIERVRAGRPVVRVVRSFQPVRVPAEERTEFVSSIEAGARKLVPDYKYDGPAIPGTKPAFHALFVDYDGRIWVQKPMPSERVPNAAANTPARREPLVYEVISREGRFLGTVRFPDGFQLYHATGDRVWGSQPGEFDVPTVVRYRIMRARAEG